LFEACDAQDNKPIENHYYLSYTIPGAMSLAYLDKIPLTQLQIDGEYPKNQAAPQSSRRGQSEKGVSSEKRNE